MKESIEIWDKIADWWDKTTLEGDCFHKELIHPNIDKLLDIKENELVLDIGCDNGVLIRKIVSQGARAVGSDCASKFIQIAQDNATDLKIQNRVEYYVIDAANEKELDKLNKFFFDSAICSMVLQDVSIAKTLKNIIKKKGKFVFAIPHPCFNGKVSFLSEERNIDNEWRTEYSIKISSYDSEIFEKEKGKPNQPIPHFNFHRPLSNILAPFLENGFFLDSMIEPVTEKNIGQKVWSEIPPVIVGRFICV